MVGGRATEHEDDLRRHIEAQDAGGGQQSRNAVKMQKGGSAGATGREANPTGNTRMHTEKGKKARERGRTGTR